MAVAEAKQPNFRHSVRAPVLTEPQTDRYFEKVVPVDFAAVAVVAEPAALEAAVVVGGLRQPNCRHLGQMPVMAEPQTDRSIGTEPAPVAAAVVEVETASGATVAAAGEEQEPQSHWAFALEPPKTGHLVVSALELPQIHQTDSRSALAVAVAY